MYHLPEYIQAIHADRLREAEAARKSRAVTICRKRRPWFRRVRVKRPSGAGAHSPA